MTTAETYSGAERMISFAIGVGKKFVADSSDPGPDLSFQCQHQATIMVSTTQTLTCVRPVVSYALASTKNKFVFFCAKIRIAKL